MCVCVYTQQSAITTLEEASQELGLRLRRVDKKSEKAAVSHVKAELMNALALEQDPAAALTYVVPLLFIKATGARSMHAFVHTQHTHLCCMGIHTHIHNVWLAVRTRCGACHMPFTCIHGASA